MTYCAGLWFLAVLGTSLSAAEPEKSEDHIEVTVTGTLRSGIIAIGGETTGVTITADGITWELALKQPELKKLAGSADGKKVVVQGQLKRKRGVEIPERYIVTVSSLKPAKVLPEKQRAAITADDEKNIRLACSDEETIIEIHSKSGIGRTKITRLGDAWPAAMTVRLHLRGLESLKAGNGTQTVQWSIASSGKPVCRTSLLTANTETPLKPGDKYYTRASLKAEQPRIPLQDGYFSVPLPPQLWASQPESIELRWIDFYRN